MREHEPLVEAVTPLAELAEKVPTLEGVPTGVPGLDELFFVTEWRDGKPMRRTLGGIPRYAVLQVTGVSDTGKSHLRAVRGGARPARGMLPLHYD